METEVKKNISASRVYMHLKCGQQDMYRNEMGIKVPPGTRQVIGTATHKSVNRNMSFKKEKGVLLPEDEVTDAARDEITGLFKDGISLVPEEEGVGLKKIKGIAVDDSVRLSRLHHKEVAPAINPTNVERYFKIELKDQPMDLAGRMDIEFKGGFVDTKTSAKSPNVKDVRADDQMTVYALAKKIETGKIPKNLRMDYLVKTQKEKYVPMVTERTQADLDRMVRLLDRVIQDITEGHYMPNPNGWWCSKSWCGYWNRCPYWSGRE